jgi:hypothetical protein
VTMPLYGTVAEIITQDARTSLNGNSSVQARRPKRLAPPGGI